MEIPAFSAPVVRWADPFLLATLGVGSVGPTTLRRRARGFCAESLYSFLHRVWSLTNVLGIHLGRIPALLQRLRTFLPINHSAVSAAVPGRCFLPPELPGPA